MTGEVEAIRIAQQQINYICDTFDNTVLFIDSIVPVLAIVNQNIDMSIEIIERRILYVVLKNLPTLDILIITQSTKET